MNKYPTKVKAEILSVLRKQLVDGVEPGDSYQLLVDTYGVTKSAIYQWKHELKQQMQPGTTSSRFTGAEKPMVIKTASMNELVNPERWIRGVTRDWDPISTTKMRLY